MDNNAPPARRRRAGLSMTARASCGRSTSLAAVLVLVAVFALQGTFDWLWAVAPLEAKRACLA